eukprot:204679_1
MKQQSELIKLASPNTTIKYTQLHELSSEQHNTTDVDGNVTLIEDETAYIKYNKRGTILSSSINFCNSLIGIGTIGLAYGLSQSGLIIGIIIFIICHTLNHITVYFMMEIASTTNISTYAIICNKCKVPLLQVVSDYSIAFNNLLSCSSYLILIGDYMSLVIQEIFDAQQSNHNQILYDRRIWILLSLVFIIPLCLIRKVEPLKYVSFVSLLCFLYVAFIVLYYKFIEQPVSSPNISIGPRAESPLSFFKTMSIFIMAYGGGHPIAFPIATELINPTIKRLNRIIWYFNTFSTIIFATVAFGGYLTFGDETDGNLLLNYPNDHISIIIVRICLCIGLGFTYPVVANVIKNSMASIVYGVGIKNDKYSLYALIYGERNEYENKLVNKDVTMISNRMYYPLVGIVILIPLILSMVTNKLSVLFQFNGATFSTYNQILFPGLIYYFAYKNGVIKHELNERNWKIIFAICVVVGGSLFIPFMLFFAFDELIGIV